MRIVIIGNGAAGNEAAETIRKYDDAVELLMISAETFPLYSACALPDCISGWVSREQLFLKDSKDYAQQNIETVFGARVIEIDKTKKQVLLEKSMLDYDRLIIATGSRGFIPPVAGAKLPGNFLIKSVRDVDHIEEHRPSRVVVVGSGNIGVEAAEALEMRGCEVTLIELAQRVMPKAFDEKPSLLLRQLLENNGIKVCTNEQVLAIDGINSVNGVITDKQKIPCDTVIWAVGVRQNTELASKAGIDIGRLGGIKVNSRMETSQEDIYACGDCIETFDLISKEPALSMLWPSAKKQAKIAAMNCMDKNVEYEGAFNVVIEEIYGKSCISIGATAVALEPGVRVIERECNDTYSRLLTKDGYILGLQSIGWCDGVGAIMALIKNRTQIAEIERVLKNPELIRRIPWYLGCTGGRDGVHRGTSDCVKTPGYTVMNP